MSWTYVAIDAADVPADEARPLAATLARFAHRYLGDIPPDRRMGLIRWAVELSSETLRSAPLPAGLAPVRVGERARGWIPTSVAYAGRWLDGPTMFLVRGRADHHTVLHELWHLTAIRRGYRSSRDDEQREADAFADSLIGPRPERRGIGRLAFDRRTDLDARDAERRADEQAALRDDVRRELARPAPEWYRRQLASTLAQLEGGR